MESLLEDGLAFGSAVLLGMAVGLERHLRLKLQSVWELLFQEWGVR